MTRKEFLENFLRCVDQGASTLDFRRYCRVKAQHLPRHMQQVNAYREELAKLLEEEAEERLAHRPSSVTDVLPVVLCGTCGLGGCSGGCVSDSSNEVICDSCGGEHTLEDCQWGGPSLVEEDISEELAAEVLEALEDVEDEDDSL